MRISLELPMNVLTDESALNLLADGGLLDICVPFEFYDQDDDFIVSRRRAFESRGMRIDSCHLPLCKYPNSVNSTCADDPEVYAKSLAMWIRYLKKFLLAPVRATPLHTGGCMYPSMPAMNREILERFLNEIAPYAADAGVYVALENTFYRKRPPYSYEVNGRSDNNTHVNDDIDMMVALAKRLDPTVFGLCLDIGHSNLFGHDPLADHANMQPYIRLYHLHDNDSTSDQHYLAGLGNIPWKAFARQAAGYTDPMYAEVQKDPDPERMAWMFTPEGLLHSFRVMTRAVSDTE